MKMPLDKKVKGHFGGPDYRYGFQGQEMDNEVKGGAGLSYDFGARMLDVRINRFLSLDPDGFKYPWSSPYNYAINSPVKFVDKNGEGPDKIVNNSSSQIKLTGSSIITLSVTENGKTTTKKFDETAGSIVLNPGDVFYEVDKDVTFVSNDGTKKITYSGGIGKIISNKGKVRYVLLNDVDYIDIEEGQTFSVNGKSLTHDNSREIDRYSKKGNRNELLRKQFSAEQEDLDGYSDTWDDLRKPTEEWIPKPNIGEIKFSDSVGQIIISDLNEGGSNSEVKVEKPGFWGKIITKEDDN